MQVRVAEERPGREVAPGIGRVGTLRREELFGSLPWSRVPTSLAPCSWAEAGSSVAKFAAPSRSGSTKGLFSCLSPVVSELRDALDDPEHRETSDHVWMAPKAPSAGSGRQIRRRPAAVTRTASTKRVAPPRRRG